MTAVPAPMPAAPVEPAAPEGVAPSTGPADSAGNADPGAARFAKVLAGVQGKGGKDSSQSTSSQSASGGTAKSGAVTPTPLPDATVASLLAAITKLVANDAKPATPTPAAGTDPGTTADADKDPLPPDLATIVGAPAIAAILVPPTMPSAPRPAVAMNPALAELVNATATPSGGAKPAAPTPGTPAAPIAPPPNAADPTAANPVATPAAAPVAPILPEPAHDKTTTVMTGVSPAVTAPHVDIAHALTTPVNTPTASAASSAPAPPPPAEQLVSVLKPLQRAADGSYQLRIELRPPELGRVDVRVELRDGVMHATINAEHPRTAELVRNALDDLRAQLDADGVRSGALNVGSGGTGANERDSDGAPAPASNDASAGTTSVTDLTAIATETDSDSLLDVRL